ncbi:MAG: hypothetical protein LBH44_13825 [Treponema sp.]|jgi:hypothetical protein|nr:hypothetical protein [Treponema sp.]
MKQKLLVSLLCLALILPFFAGAQEDEEAGETPVQPVQSVNTTDSESGDTASAPKSVPASSGGQVKVSQVALPTGGIGGVIGMIVGYLSHITDLFGKATGMRIGGSSLTAIIMLVIASVIKDKAPPWLRYVLYAAGGTMFAGSGANITQMLMSSLAQ